MSNEITITTSLSFTKDGKSETLNYSALTYDMTGGDYIHGTLSVTTSEVAIPKGNITTPGFMVIKNLDLTNSVQLRPATGGADCINLKAGEVALFRHQGTAPYAIATGGTCEIEYLLLEA